MRKSALFIAFLTFFAVVSTAYAHPPSDIKISFEPSTKVVKAVIIHNVSNVLNHYISKVDVGLNGKEIIEQSISRQDNNDSQTVSYFIPDLKAGDEISVEGYCSISGTLKKKIVVEM
jgi:hypothetical protein